VDCVICGKKILPEDFPDEDIKKHKFPFCRDHFFECNGYLLAHRQQNKSIMGKIAVIEDYIHRYSKFSNMAQSKLAE